MEKRKQIVMVVFLLGLIFLAGGVSYAFFTYQKTGETIQTVQTGTLAFVYEEENRNGNSIELTNAFPMSDEEGKRQTGDSKVFEFQVKGTAQGAPIFYEIYLTKEASSSFPETAIRTYLTTVSNNTEEEVFDPMNQQAINFYSGLGISQVPDVERGKTLYQEVIADGTDNYSKTFRYRMWIDENANQTYNGRWIHSGKSFSVKVNVYARNGDTVPLPIYQDPSGANSPELIEGLIPVTYNETTKNWVKADPGSSWYDYSNQMWANAVTVSEANRASYMSATSGTVIPMDDIQTMWVWIPRYEYQYTNLNAQYAGGSAAQPGEIQINFISQNVTSPSEASQYKGHPAFTFGDKELSGFWYAKFETSSSDPRIENYGGGNTADLDLYIKPNVNSWRMIDINNQVIMSKKLTSSGNIYGLPTSADSHPSMNSEWGSVAYLSQSKYGKYGNSNFSGEDKEVYINNYGETTYYTTLTGCSGGIPSTEVYSTTCAYTYEVPNSGTGASTSGTIYGVYDMSGGAWDYVMGNLSNTFGSSGLSAMPEAKYYDLYTTTISTTACGGSVCYGHSLSETEGWYNDYAVMITEKHPWLARGGRFIYGSSAGVFYFIDTSGGAYIDSTFRLVLVS